MGKKNGAREFDRLQKQATAARRAAQKAFTARIKRAIGPIGPEVYTSVSAEAYFTHLSAGLKAA